jgi:hypothetical protein
LRLSRTVEAIAMRAEQPDWKEWARARLAAMR